MVELSWSVGLICICGGWRAEHGARRRDAQYGVDTRLALAHPFFVLFLHRRFFQSEGLGHGGHNPHFLVSESCLFLLMPLLDMTI